MSRREKGKKMKRSPKPFSTEVTTKSSNNETKVKNQHLKFKYSKFSLVVFIHDDVVGGDEEKFLARSLLFRFVLVRLGLAVDSRKNCLSQSHFSELASGRRFVNFFTSQPTENSTKVNECFHAKIISCSTETFRLRWISLPSTESSLMTVSTCSQQQSSLLFTYISLTSAPPLISTAARVVSSESWRSTSSHSLHMSLDKITTHRVVVVMQPLRNRYSAQCAMMRVQKWQFSLTISLVFDHSNGSLWRWFHAHAMLIGGILRLLICEWCGFIAVPYLWQLSANSSFFSLASLAALRFTLNAILQRMNYFQWDISVFMG